MDAEVDGKRKDSEKDSGDRIPRTMEMSVPLRANDSYLSLSLSPSLFPSSLGSWIHRDMATKKETEVVSRRTWDLLGI